MAIALGLDPAWDTTTATSIASAAFSPVANSLIIVESHVDAATSPTITDSVGLTWTAIGTPQAASTGGRAAAWWAFTASARTNMTVTVNWSSPANKAIKIKTWTGTASASAVISKAQSVSTTTPLNLSVATTNDGCRISGSALDWNARGGPTSSDDEISFTITGAISGTSVHKAANSSGVGTSVTLNIVKGTVSGLAADWAYKVWEIVPAAGGATDLTVADASQAHTADSVTITVAPINLTVADASQAQTADQVSLAVDLIVASASQAHAADSVTLVVNLTVADASQAQTADNVVLTSGGIDLVPAAATQAHTADSVTLAVDLIVANASQAHTADSVTITVAPINLTVADASQAQTADQVSLTGGASLAVADATQAQTSGTPTLTQLHVLVVDAASQAQTSSDVALTQVHVLTVADANQAQTADAVMLTLIINLVVAAASQAQTSTSPTLSQISLVAGSMALGYRPDPTAMAATPSPGPTMAETANRSGATMTGG